jgi:hypothetical protein
MKEKTIRLGKMSFDIDFRKLILSSLAIEFYNWMKKNRPNYKLKITKTFKKILQHEELIRRLCIHRNGNFKTKKQIQDSRLTINEDLILDEIIKKPINYVVLLVEGMIELNVYIAPITKNTLGLNPSFYTIFRFQDKKNRIQETNITDIQLPDLMKVDNRVDVFMQFYYRKSLEAIREKIFGTEEIFDPWNS